MSEDIKECTSEELYAIFDIVSNSLDVEISRVLDEENLKHISGRLLDFYYKTELHNFFLPLSLKDVTESIFTSVPMRDFILAVTRRSYLEINSLLPDIDALVHSVVSTTELTVNRAGKPDNSLIPKHLYESIYVDKDVVNVCLKNNTWLVILYLCLSNLHNTVYFKSYITK